MLTNEVKRKLEAGKPVAGVWLALGDSIVAESLAAQGWDWLTVDTEHNPFDLLTMTGGPTTSAIPWIPRPRSTRPTRSTRRRSRPSCDRPGGTAWRPAYTRRLPRRSTAGSRKGG